MLFLVIFKEAKSDNFLIGEINPFERLNGPSHAKSRTNDVTSKYHLHHFGTS